MTAKRRNTQGVQEAYRVFFEAVKADDIGILVSAAWEFFGMPVLLTDEHYKLVCQYPNRKLGQAIWDTLYDHKVLPLELVQEYQRFYLNMHERYYKPFYSAEGLAADCPRIFGEVYSEERIYGHIAIFLFDCPLLPEDLQAVEIFLDALKILLVPRKNRESASLASYLYDLLNDGAAPQSKVLAHRCLSACIAGPYSVLVTPIGDTASQRAFAAMVISQMPLTFRSTVNVIYKDCIVTLFGLMQGGHYSEKEVAFFRRISDYLSPSNTSSGISQPFADLSELSGRFQQAELTARVTKKPCEFFDAVFPAQLFQVVCANIRADLFIHPALKRLREYDQANQTEYFRTLQLYSLTLHNKEETAHILCIHRNTLLYRLNKIRELFGIPYEETRTALALLNSFQLYGAAVEKRPDFGLGYQKKTTTY
jgi:hypothetical protein